MHAFQSVAVACSALQAWLLQLQGGRLLVFRMTACACLRVTDQCTFRFQDLSRTQAIAEKEASNSPGARYKGVDQTPLQCSSPNTPLLFHYPYMKLDCRWWPRGISPEQRLYQRLRACAWDWNVVANPEGYLTLLDSLARKRDDRAHTETHEKNENLINT